MTITTAIELIGHKVTLVGYDQPGHVFYGVIASVIKLKQFQRASDDNWYECAYLLDANGEPIGYYPVMFLSLKDANRG